MRKEEFIHALCDELIRQGISEETARHYVHAIEESLNDSDLTEIEQMQDTGEIKKLARGIILFRQRSGGEGQKTAAPSSAEETAPKEGGSAEAARTDSSPAEEDAVFASPADGTPSDGEPGDETVVLSEEEEEEEESYEKDAVYDLDDDVKIFTGTFTPSPRTSQAEPEIAEPEYEEPEYEEIIRDDDFLQQEPTPRGKRIFWGMFIGTLPITLLLLAAYFILFGGVFGVLCALIVVLVAGLIALVAAGAAVSLVGIVYGITQLISVASAAPGLYEIGLGVTVGGAVMLSGILIYNLAIRLLPFLIRHLVFLFGICGDKLRELFRRVKEACYRL